MWSVEARGRVAAVATGRLIVFNPKLFVSGLGALAVVLESRGEECASLQAQHLDAGNAGEGTPLIKVEDEGLVGRLPCVLAELRRAGDPLDRSRGQLLHVVHHPAR